MASSTTSKDVITLYGDSIIGCKDPKKADTWIPLFGCRSCSSAGGVDPRSVRTITLIEGDGCTRICFHSVCGDCGAVQSWGGTAEVAHLSAGFVPDAIVSDPENIPGAKVTSSVARG